MSQKTISKIFKIFNPGPDFPAISISGTKCELDCAHCGGKYLEHMLEANSPEKLLKICQKLDARGATGALISGGCDSNGKVMMTKFMDTFKVVKNQTNLILNVHTGLISNKEAKMLAKAGVDIASVDVVGDADTIRNVYGLRHTPNQYQNLLQTLHDYGINRIVPHICIGLDFGKVKGEFNALDLIKNNNPDAIVFIILIPTIGTKMENCSPPGIPEVIEVINHARTKFSSTPLYLGCMRPRFSNYRNYTRELEIATIKAGINGIVLPSKTTLNYLKEKQIKLSINKNCCAVV